MALSDGDYFYGTVVESFFCDPGHVIYYPEYIDSGFVCHVSRTWSYQPPLCLGNETFELSFFVTDTVMLFEIFGNNFNSISLFTFPKCKETQMISSSI